MAEKKAETKKSGKRPAKKRAVPEKSESKKPNKSSKKAKSAKPKKVETKIPEVKVEVESENETKKKEEKNMRKKDHRAFWSALITFFITSLIFGMAFFIFMNLEVIDRDGTVKIDHGRIYVDNLQNQCKSDVIRNDSGTADSGKDESDADELVTNPSQRVDVKNAQLVEVGDFEVYIPIKFRAAKGNGNGKYIFNLMNDDGWADVKIYAEKTSSDLLDYIAKKDSLLELTNSTYYMNGTSWVEMESGTSVAYGTRLGDTVYVVILNVKLESDTTGEAEQMIPKTIRLKRVYK